MLVNSITHTCRPILFTVVIHNKIIIASSASVYISYVRFLSIFVIEKGIKEEEEEQQQHEKEKSEKKIHKILFSLKTVKTQKQKIREINEGKRIQNREKLSWIL